MPSSLVTILTPCYNAGKYIHRLLDSVLQQTYQNVEMIIIDDGSKDESAEIIRGYVSKFEQRGYILLYKYKENGGQSSAINMGLKYVKGKYLIWPDSDDWFRTNDALEKFVTAFSALDDSYGIVRCLPTYINENNKSESFTQSYTTDVFQFENCLYRKNFFWGAGNYMLKMDLFDKINEHRQIYEEKDAGQNWQMLLPMFYSYKCHTILESYLNVLERADSHSRGMYNNSYKQNLKLIDVYERTLQHTIDKLEINPREKYLYKHETKKMFLFDRYDIGLKNMVYQDVKMFFNELKKQGHKFSFYNTIQVYLLRFPHIYILLQKVIHLLRNAK